MRKHFTVSRYNISSCRLHTLITAAFSHEELHHLAHNLIWLLGIGPELQVQLGREETLLLYLLGGLGGSLASLALHGERCSSPSLPNGQNSVGRGGVKRRWVKRRWAGRALTDDRGGVGRWPARRGELRGRRCLRRGLRDGGLQLRAAPRPPLHVGWLPADSAPDLGHAPVHRHAVVSAGWSSRLRRTPRRGGNRCGLQCGLS
jgi:hypothetical protein